MKTEHEEQSNLNKSKVKKIEGVGVASHTQHEGEYFESMDAEEIVKEETGFVLEDENELNDSLEDMEGTKIKLENSMEKRDENVECMVQNKCAKLEADTSDSGAETGDYFVCPISSCAFFMADNNEFLRLEHLKSSHPNNDINILNFLKL